MRLLGIVLISAAMACVFVGLVVPVVANRILGLGLDVPQVLGRPVPSYPLVLILSHPWISLAAGLFLLALFGWGIWKLA